MLEGVAVCRIAFCLACVLFCALPSNAQETVVANTRGVATVTRDDLKVSVIYQGISKVELTFPGQRKLEGHSKNELLQFAVVIQNESETRKATYKSWCHWLDGNAAVKDELGNTYARVTFGLHRPAGRVDQDLVYPGKKLLDVLVFERPVDKASELTVELPGSNISKSGVMTFRFPRESWVTAKEVEQADARAAAAKAAALAQQRAKEALEAKRVVRFAGMSAEFGKEPGWTDASKGPSMANDISVSIESARFGLVALRSRGAMTRSTDRKLVLKIKLTNNSKEKVAYRSWSKATDPMVADETGIAWLVPRWPAGTSVVLQVDGADISPKGSISDLLVLDSPGVQVKFLRVELPGANIGSGSPFRFEIPRSMILVKD